MNKFAIIGGGPAGGSAAIYASRGGLSVTVFDGAQSALSRAKEIENYYGFATPVSGDALLRAGRAQMERLGAKLVEKEVTGISFSEAGFCVETATTKEEFDSLLLACGVARQKPRLARIDELTGKGVSFCATCDGFLYRNKSVAVLGCGAYALREARALAPLAGRVTLLTNGARAPECEFDAITTPLTDLLGDDAFSGVRFADQSRQAFDGLFLALGVAGASAFASELGILSQNGGFLTVDANMQTNVPRLYAAGDCTGTPMQVAKAVYQGMVAAEHLLKSNGKN